MIGHHFSIPALRRTQGFRRLLISREYLLAQPGKLLTHRFVR
jgi:hypothetical protein